ncbi:MAG: glucosaminidase domain-containing protein [Flavobacteriales bacterium]|nr:glucosaminidase domain-containing protein [Flavobacteriales bacterium]
MRIVGSWKTLVASALTVSVAPAFGQRMTAEEYIAQWQEVAVRKMHEHGIPASITLAQGLLESGNGNSELARKGNNHFGIKCTPDWGGGKIYHDDDRRHECFRKYRDAADSFEDHSKFLMKPRYAALFELKTTDYKGWAHGLHKAGYATDPRYPQKLIELIERYQLDKFDEGGRPAARRDPPQEEHRNNAHADPSRGREDGAMTVTIGGTRPIERYDGRIKFVRARAGDTFRSLADEFGMMPGPLARYNDLPKNGAIAEGMVVFLQPKRSRAHDADTHVVREGESLWSISQAHGMKLDKLAEYNGLRTDAPVRPGTTLWLRKPRR